MSNIVRVRVTVQGTRPLLQHRFGPDSIPLEKEERTGVAGNDPEEWRKSCMVNGDGQLFILPSYVFGCFGKGALNTKKGRGTVQPLVWSTLQVEDAVILIDRWMPKDGKPPMNHPSFDPSWDVYIDVAGVRNPQTKARNVRYRLAASPGWKAIFTIRWDKTVVGREIMRAVARDSGILGGLGDGIKVGFGRFEIAEWLELTDAEETTATGDLGADKGANLEPRRRKVPTAGVRQNGPAEPVPR